MNYYKLTNQKMQTHNGFQWTLKKWVRTSGRGALCTSGWLHCYNHPLLAVLFNPIHAGIENPRLFEVGIKGKRKTDRGLKFGFTQMRLIKELPFSQITRIQKIAFTILCVKEIYKNEGWNQWADNWLSGKDRSNDAAYDATDAATAAAYTTAAAYAAYAYTTADTAATAAAYAAYAVTTAAAPVYANAAADVTYANAAAYAAYAVDVLNLIKLAKKAMEY